MKIEEDKLFLQQRAYSLSSPVQERKIAEENKRLKHMPSITESSSSLHDHCPTKSQNVYALSSSSSSKSLTELSSDESTATLSQCLLQTGAGKILLRQNKLRL